MNRVVAPAFYAQGNTKSPTLAGILGLAINMIFALILIKPMSGGGIALALTLGSLANSILLFVFLKKNKQIDVKAVVGGTILYSIKMAVLSVIAAVPATLVKNATSAFFAGRGRLVEFGGTVVLTAIVFAFAGILLLLITKDPVLASAKNMVLKKVKK